MFSRTLRLACIALISSALSVSAVRSLSLQLSGADQVVGVDNLRVVATVTNTGDETLKLLNDPRGPLSTMPAETFGIIHEQTGVAPVFTGVKAKYVPSIAVRIGGKDAFTILAPGQSVQVEHDREWSKVSS